MCCLLALSGLWGMPALADSNPISTIAEGQVAVGVRSDVKVTIAGTGGTKQVHLQALASVIGKAVPGIRGCYRKLVRRTPTTVGTLRLTVSLKGRRSRPLLKFSDRGEPLPKLERCVRRAMIRADYAGVPKPAAALVKMDFDNSRAQGQMAMAEATALVRHVDVQHSEEGTALAKWATPDARLAFTVSGRGRRADAAVTSAIQALREGYAGFLDCRRRSEKGGLSGAGEVVATVRARRNQKPLVKINTCGLAHERAPICMARAFRLAPLKRMPPGTKVEVRVMLSE